MTLGTFKSKGYWKVMWRENGVISYDNKRKLPRFGVGYDFYPTSCGFLSLSLGVHGITVHIKHDYNVSRQLVHEHLERLVDIIPGMYKMHENAWEWCNDRIRILVPTLSLSLLSWWEILLFLVPDTIFLLCLLLPTILSWWEILLFPVPVTIFLLCLLLPTISRLFFISSGWLPWVSHSENTPHFITTARLLQIHFDFGHPCSHFVCCHFSDFLRIRHFVS